MSRVLVLTFLALLALPAAAQAGGYHVYTCSAAGKVWPNGAWRATAHAGVNIDASCAGNTIGLTVPAGARMDNNSSAALTFTSPPGTTIANFALSRQLGYTNPVAENTHKYFVLYSLGGTHFAGAGNFHDPTRNALNAQKHWYGYPEGNVAIGRRGGSDPVTLTASDSAGIRRVELVDVTNPLAPAVVGREDYAEVRTQANRVCDYSLPAPCPSLSRETITAT